MIKKLKDRKILIINLIKTNHKQKKKRIKWKL